MEHSCVPPIYEFDFDRKNRIVDGCRLKTSIKSAIFLLLLIYFSSSWRSIELDSRFFFQWNPFFLTVKLIGEFRVEFWGKFRWAAITSDYNHLGQRMSFRYRYWHTHTWCFVLFKKGGKIDTGVLIEMWSKKYILFTNIFCSKFVYFVPLALTIEIQKYYWVFVS